MHVITSALGRHAALVHAIAGLVIALALLMLGVELVRFVISAVKGKHASRPRKARAALASAPREAQPREAQPREAQPDPTSSDDALDRDSSADVPRVFLLCHDDVEPDEATFPYARILVSARGDSDAGKKRPRNEDSFLLLPDHSLFAVADGMGGYHGGQVASTLAVETLKQAFDQTSFEDEFQSDAPIPRRGRELATALVKANRAVFQAAQADPALSEMGTTMVAARFSPDKRRVYIAHVGDSRCYRLRGSALRQLTTDHTMRHLGLEGPRANDLFRAVGIEQNVTIDLVVDIPHPEDIYLLCSDGLPKMVKDESIAEALRSETDLEAAVYRLIELANDAGGRDNVTVVLVRVRDQSKLEADLFEGSADGDERSDPSRQAKRKAAHAPTAGAKSGPLP